MSKGVELTGCLAKLDEGHMQGMKCRYASMQEKLAVYLVYCSALGTVVTDRLLLF
jgi:hypothetical protein